MCGLCGAFGVIADWSDDDPSVTSEPSSRKTSRRRRLAVVNRWIDTSVVVEDWMGTSLIVRGATGRSQVVQSFGGIWAAVEAVGARVPDVLSVGWRSR